MNWLTITNYYIPKEIEEYIISQIPDNWPTVNKHRAVQEYGKSIYLGEEETPIPQWMHVAFPKLITEKTHVSITRYLPGDFIGPHIDKPEGGDVIKILSLLSDAIMVFKKGEHTEWYNLLSRSLIEISGEARWEWTHELLPVKDLRYSIVFRN